MGDAVVEPWPYSDWISPQVVQAAADQPRVILDAAQSRIHVLDEKVRLLEAKQENERLQHEQVYHDLEARWQAALQSSAQKEEALRVLQQQMESQRVTMVDAAETEAALRDAAKQQAQRAAQLQTQVEALEARQREHLAILEQRHRELDVQRAESARLAEAERTLRTEKQELDRRVVQLDAELIQTRYQLHKCSTEHTEIVKSRDWLEQQLAARTEQLSSAQAALAALEADHRTTASSLQAELATREQRVIELEHNQTFIVTERDRLRAELNALQQSCTQMQIQMEAKLEAQQRLIELHSAKSDDAQKALLEAQAREEAAHQLVAQLKEQREASALKEAEKVSSLQEQLDAALQDVVAARSLGRPGVDDVGHKTLTEVQLQGEVDRLVSMDPSGRKHLEMLVTLQHKYELAAESLRSERLEKNRLLALLQQIAEDLAAKEPQIERNRRDFERAKSEHAQLSASLEQSLSQNDQLRMQLEVLQRDSAVLKQENDDLSRQVSVLLKECQQLESHSKTADIAQSGDMMEGNFTFRNIKELQERYRELLRMVRELSSEEADSTKQTTKQLLETALSELRQVSQTRERQEEKLRHYSHLVESQKILIQEQESKYQQLMVQYQRLHAGQSDVSISLPAVSPTQASFNDSARLQELAATVDTLREELKVSRETTLALRLELATDKAKLDAETQRNNASSRALANMEDQVRDLRLRNAEFTRQVAELEKQNAQLLLDRTRARDQATALEFKLQAERVSLQLLEESSERYQKDIASLREERASRDSLLSQMQALLAERQSAVDSVRLHAEASSREMNAQIVTLRDDLQRVRELLQSERQELHLLRISAAQQVESAQAKVNSLAKELAQKEQEVQAAKSELENALRQLADAPAEQPHSVPPVEVSTLGFEGADAAVASEAAAAIAARKRGQELRLARAQLKSKEEELRAVQDHLDSYRKISQESAEAFRQLQASSASQLSEATRRIEQLNHQLVSSQETLMRYEQELSTLRDAAREHESKIAAVEASFSARISQLDEALRTSAAEREIANTRQIAAETECRSLAAAVKELQSNYQRQVKELADALQKASELQDSREDLQRQLDHARSELSVATARESTSAAEHSTLVASLRKEILEERDRAEDAISQVTSLLRQVDTLTHGLTSAGLSVFPPDSNISSDASSMERINFLRREVEIHQLQISVLRQDLEHAKLQADHFRQQTDSYRQLLADEQQKRVVAAQSQSDYAERSHLLDQVNLLRESNVTLRQETATSATRISQLEQQLRMLESEKAPLAAQVLESTQQIDALRVELHEARESLRMWQQRFQDMITRYQHVDPDQHNALKQEVDSLKQQLSIVTTQFEAARKELETVQADATGAQTENLKRQLDTARADLAKKTQKFNELLEKAKKLEQDKKAAEQSRRDTEVQNSELLNQLNTLQQSLDSLTKQPPTPSDASIRTSADGSSSLLQEIENLKAQLAAVDGEKAALLKDVDDLTSAVGEFEALANTLRVEKEETQTHVKRSEEKVLELEQKLKEMQSTLEKKEVSLKRLYTFWKTHKDGSKTSDSSAQESVAQEAPAQEQTSSHSDSREAELREQLLTQQQSPESVTPISSGPDPESAPTKSLAKPPVKPALAPPGAAKKGKQLPVRGGPAAKKLAAKAAAALTPSPSSPSADVMSPEAIAKRSRKFSQISASVDGDKNNDTTSAPKRQKTTETPEEPKQGN